MWLAKQSPPTVDTTNCMGKMDSGCVVGKSRQGQGVYCLPYGIQSVPPSGSDLFMAPNQDQEVCCGVIARPGTVPGEVVLRSSGGAEIRLCNNGKVLINGKEFT